jgi:hypothetical protein
MKAQALLSKLRESGVELAVEGLQLTVDAPAGAITGDLREALVENKPRLIKLLVRERRKLEVADERGLIIRRSRERGYVTLHDPLTGDWHDFPTKDCFPSIVAEANTRRTGGAA